MQRGGTCSPALAPQRKLWSARSQTLQACNHASVREAAARSPACCAVSRLSILRLNALCTVFGLAGGELFRLLEKQGRLSEPAARFYAACALTGLAALHRRGIAYRVRPGPRRSRPTLSRAHRSGCPDMPQMRPAGTRPSRWCIKSSSSYATCPAFCLNGNPVCLHEQQPGNCANSKDQASDHFTS